MRRGDWRQGLAVWGTVAALAACGGGRDDPATPGVATIGAAGGTVSSGDGAQVVFPKGALRGAVTVRIAKDSTGAPPLPPSAVAAGAVYTITPHGGEFELHAEVSIPVERGALGEDAQLLLVTAEPGDTQWRVLSGTGLADGKLRAQVMHFSYFQVIKLIDYVMPSLVTMIAYANNTGADDAWAIPSGHDLTSHLFTPSGERRYSPSPYFTARLHFPAVAASVGAVPGSPRRAEYCLPTNYGHDGAQVRFFRDGTRLPNLIGKHYSSGPLDSAQYPRTENDWIGGVSWMTFSGVGALHYYGQDVPRLGAYGQPSDPARALDVWALPPAANVATDDLLTWSGEAAFVARDHNGRMRIEASVPTSCGLTVEAVAINFRLNIVERAVGYLGLNLLPEVHHAVVMAGLGTPATLVVGEVQPEDFPGQSINGPFTSPLTTLESSVRWEYSSDAHDWQALPVSGQATASGPLLVPPNGFTWWDTPLVQYTLGFEAVTQAQAGHYRTMSCARSDPAVCLRGQIVELVVRSELPSVSRQPVNQSVRVGETASFSVTIAGVPASQLQWQKRSFVAAAFGFLDWTDVEGATGATYTTPPLALADSATQYRAWASNALGGVASDIAMLTVVERLTPPVIEAQPGNLNVTVGGTAVFAATVSGPGPLSYQWRRDGVAIAGANGPILTLSNVTALDDGRYDLVVTNGAGSTTTDPGLLQVTLGTPIPLAPSIAASPASITVAAGNAANFAVAVTGTGPYTYQWFKGGVTAPVAEGDFPSYGIAAVTPADAGAYSVRVTNGVGSVLSAAATLTVGPGTGVPLAPTITTAPFALAVPPGGAATFAVAVAGTGPFTYQWRRNGADVAGATAAVLHLAAVGALDGGLYAVEVRNAVGTASSASVPLIVIGAPLITGQPFAATTTEGTAATLSVVASGDGLLYQWTRDQIAIPGATAASYTTPALTLADHGASYGVIVYNGAGLAFSQPAVLSVVAAVAIGGSVSGLSGAGLVLQNNAGDDLAVLASGSFTFATTIALGTTYSVTVLSQPSGQTCAIQGGSGTASAAVSSVLVTCTSASALALVANSGANTLSVMRVDADTGALTAAGAPVATGQYPFDVAITPNGQFAYVGNLVSGTISSFGIDGVTGVLTPIPSSTPGTRNPYGIAMDPLGRFLWVANYGFSTASAFAIDPGTGVLTAVGSPVATGFPYDLAVHPSGSFVYVANEAGNSVSVFSVDASTGALTLVPGTIANSVLGPHGLAVDPSGRFVYAASAGGQSVAAYRINPSTGALAVVGYVNTGGSAESVAVHPNGLFVYVVNQSSKDVAIFSINQTTGALTSAGPKVAAGSGPRRLAVNASGSRLYVTDFAADAVSVFSIGDGGATLGALGAAATVGSAPEGMALTP